MSNHPTSEFVSCTTKYVNDDYETGLFVQAVTSNNEKFHYFFDIRHFHTIGSLTMTTDHQGNTSYSVDIANLINYLNERYVYRPQRLNELRDMSPQEFQARYGGSNQ